MVKSLARKGNFSGLIVISKTIFTVGKYGLFYLPTNIIEERSNGVFN